MLSIRGSWSVSDIFTDLSAGPASFKAPGMPEDTVAHYGFTVCCNKLLSRLLDGNLLEKALSLYPDYDFVITGHSLGAGLAILVGAKLRAHHPNLKVYAFATPNGLLTREASKYTEQFVFTVVIGDDFVARMSLEAVENLKVGILETLQSCKLPKVIKKFVFGQYLILTVIFRTVPNNSQWNCLCDSRNPHERLREYLVRCHRATTAVKSFFDSS